MTFDPVNDGIDHINIYSKGKTELGRWLTNFAFSPFKHPIYGEFDSMEGFWYYIKTGEVYEELRWMRGWDAKQYGKCIEAVPREDFEDIICSGIRYKLLHNPVMLNKLINCHLPLAHYYVYGGKAVAAGYEWITEYIDSVRTSCQNAGFKAKE